MTDLTASERKATIEELDQKVSAGVLSIGQLIKGIRTDLYGMTQAQYAKFSRVSDKTLRDIEKGKTDPRLSVVNKLLKPGGFEMSARARQRSSDTSKS